MASTRPVRMPMALAMRRFCVTRASRDRARFFQDQRQQGDNQQAEHDDPDPVVGQQYAAIEFDRAAHPARVPHLLVGRAEDRAHELLQNQAEAPGRQQRFERATIEKTDDAAFDRDSERSRDQKGHRNGDRQRQVETGGNVVRKISCTTKVV